MHRTLIARLEALKCVPITSSIFVNAVENTDLVLRERMVEL